MQWFGENWNAPVCGYVPHAKTPVGEKCVWCSETIEKDDRGFIGGNQIIHLECDVRSIIGGINHQKKLCTCCGGTEEPDPENLTIRQAAKAAADYWWEQSKVRAPMIANLYGEKNE